MEWRYALAASLGAGHARAGLPCQDRALVRIVRDLQDSPVLVAAVSDGAGSAGRGEAGAELATVAFVEGVAAALRKTWLESVVRADVLAWLADARAGLEGLAAMEGRVLGDYACTLLGAVVGRDVAVLVQIGDGAILLREADKTEWDYAFWPQNGELVNATYFLTDPDALTRVEAHVAPMRIDEIALVTDGLQPLALDYEARRTHAPFVEGLMGPIRKLTSVGESPELSAQLARFLSSPRVLARTDDDKSVVIATRCDPR